MQVERFITNSRNAIFQHVIRVHPFYIFPFESSAKYNFEYLTNVNATQTYVLELRFVYNPQAIKYENIEYT